MPRSKAWDGREAGFIVQCALILVYLGLDAGRWMLDRTLDSYCTADAECLTLHKRTQAAGYGYLLCTQRRPLDFALQNAG